MFDMEKAIAEWRRQMLAAGLKALELLDELESHLREDAARQTQSGLSAEQAFEAAVARIGQAGSLRREFAKISGRKWAPLTRLKGLLVGTFVPFPSLHTFTPGARQTLERARTEAPRLHHNFVGTEHVLLALLTLENGVVPNVLQRMNVDCESLKKRIEEWVSIFPSEGTTAHLPFTPRVKKSLLLAAREAKACHQALVGAEHIFLGLLLEGDGVAGRVLKNIGLNSETTRQEILRELDGTL